jgi:hypothetical protein
MRFSFPDEIHPHEFHLERIMQIKSTLLGLGLAAVSTFSATADTFKLAEKDVEGMERLLV